MNGIERITRRIEEDSRSEIERILNEAREEADRIRSSYLAQANREKGEMTARNAKAASEREERLISAAQMEARKTALAARQEMVGRAYALALEKLRKMPEERSVEVLSALMAESAPGGVGEAVFSPEDRERFGEAAVAGANALLAKQGVEGKLTLSQETRPLQGGFILKSGRVEVNCTFATLVRLQETETAGEVAKKLFG